MVDETRRTIDSWEPVASKGGTLDICEEMMGLAFRIVGRTLFGADMTEETSAALESISVLEQQTNDRFLEWLAPPLWVPTEENRAFRRAIEEIDVIVLRLIEWSRREPSMKSGVLGALVDAAKTDPELTDKLIRDETVSR
jgi:cytochrome P450